MACLALMCPASAEAEQTFLVRHSIEMTRLSEAVHPEAGYGAPSLFHPSPDGAHVAVVTRRGNLETGFNEFRLLIFDSAEISSFVASEDAHVLPGAELAASFDTASATPQSAWATAGVAQSEFIGITSVQWVSSRVLAFIGRGPDGVGQVYSYSLTEHALQQLTTHANDVLEFGTSADLNTIVFAAATPPDWTERNAHGWVVGGEQLYLMSKVDPSEAANLNIRRFVLDRRRGTRWEVPATPLTNVSSGIFVAPSGRYAIISSPVPEFPEGWRDFPPIRSVPVRAADTPSLLEFDDVFARTTVRFRQFQILDLETHSVRPLLNAPTPGRTEGRLTAHWSPDERSILLPPSYLPVANRDAGSSDVTWILTRDVGSTAARRVISTRAARGERGRPAGSLIETGWTESGNVWALFVENGATHATYIEFRRAGEAWREHVTRTAPLPDAEGGSAVANLELRVAQDLDVPPDLVARDSRTGRERKFTEFNPNFAGIQLGRTERFTWTDRLGRQLSGGLVYPPDYEAGRRYPVVLQGNGFYPHEFLVDGSFGSPPHAAQALASRGILVLQVGDRATYAGGDERFATGAHGDARFEDYGETPRYQAIIEGAIDALDAAGLIDRERVGLLGWSRIGMLMQYTLTFSDYPIAAAAISDSFTLSTFCYTAGYGSAYGSGMDTTESEYGTFTTVGAFPWAEGVQRWIDRSYMYHLDRVRTAVRFEHYGSRTLPCNWESYAILRRRHVPAEMYHLPLASHTLASPNSLRASREANVDWFDFWLNGEEDPDASKRSQYQRWRTLREEWLATRDADIARTPP